MEKQDFKLGIDIQLPLRRAGLSDMEQGTPEIAGRHFCSRNNKQGQSREAVTYKKISGDLQMKMLSKHFNVSATKWK
jgi:hypothetical protein